MAFPSLVPSARQFSPGSWPVRTFKAQDGAEVRLLYGNRRTNMKLTLSYNNITDTQAESFLNHFYEVRGTYDTFTLPDATGNGWAGTPGALTAAISGNRWRYEEEPQISAVRPGVSSLNLTLIGVF
jgi:hypothetical protein